MTEEIETNFPQGHFSWDDRKPTDVASILKQFLRFVCVCVCVCVSVCLSVHVHACMCIYLFIDSLSQLPVNWYH